MLGAEHDVVDKRCEFVGQIRGQDPAEGTLVRQGRAINYTLDIAPSGQNVCH